MRFEGILKSWNDERGFGFLEPLQSHEDVFVHVKAFRRGVGRPQVGQAMSFEVEVGPEGKKRAKNVEPIRAGQISRRALKRSNEERTSPTLIAIPLFLSLYVILSVVWGLPLVIGGVYVGISLITYVIYYLDKSAAAQNGRRTPEVKLHILALIGGWPGALVAQQTLRHKCTKVEFQKVFWATVVLNTLVLVFLCWIWAASVSAPPSAR